MILPQLFGGVVVQVSSIQTNRYPRFCPLDRCAELRMGIQGGKDNLSVGALLEKPTKPRACKRAVVDHHERSFPRSGRFEPGVRKVERVAQHSENNQASTGNPNKVSVFKRATLETVEEAFGKHLTVALNLIVAHMSSPFEQGPDASAQTPKNGSLLLTQIP
jgi:hypothetical protein